MGFKVNLRAVVYALSDALDLVGVDELYHGKRVTQMAMTCARYLGMENETLNNLFDASILHDCGVSSTREHQKIISKMAWKDTHIHCERGYELLKPCPSLSHLAEIVRFHHTHWDRLHEVQQNPELALHSNLIFLVDRVDALVLQRVEDNLLLAKKEIRETVKELHGTMFSPELVEIFLEASNNVAFWLGLEEEHLNRHLSRKAEDSYPEEVDFSTLKSIAEIFSNIVDTKSKYTEEHSKGVARLARFIGELFGLPEQNCDMLEIAGLLHDLGKLRVPDEILEKPSRLNKEEFAVMERHSFDSYAIIGKIKGFEEIARWTALHHEKPSGKGYPFSLTRLEMALEARILGVVDVFQALAQDRPHRPAFSPKEVLYTLEEMVRKGQLDTEVVTMIGKYLEDCWEAAVGKKKPEGPVL